MPKLFCFKDLSHPLYKDFLFEKIDENKDIDQQQLKVYQTRYRYSKNNEAKVLAYLADIIVEKVKGKKIKDLNTAQEILDLSINSSEVFLKASNGELLISGKLLIEHFGQAINFLMSDETLPRENFSRFYSQIPSPPPDFGKSEQDSDEENIYEEVDSWMQYNN